MEKLHGFILFFLVPTQQFTEKNIHLPFVFWILINEPRNIKHVVELENKTVTQYYCKRFISYSKCSLDEAIIRVFEFSQT